METYTNGLEPNRAVRRGFRRKEKLLRLRFEGTQLDGLEATVRPVPVGLVFDVAEMAELSDPTTGTDTDTSGAKATAEMFRAFADSLVEWNYETPDGVPIPPTLEGLRSLDIDEAKDLIQAWMQAAAGVSGPLEQNSTDGRPSGVVSLPMGPSSRNPQSFIAPN